MVRHLQIRRWLSAMLVLPLAAGPAFGADGIICGIVAPDCPHCGAPGSPPCPANVKYFGYYPTRWRPWPGTEVAPLTAPAVQTPPIQVEVPPAEQEGVGKPGATSGDSGGATPPASPTTDTNSSNTPTPGNPNAAPPAAGVPMLNGLPLPGGSQLPNGAAAPNTPMLNGLPLPNAAQPGTVQPGTVQPGTVQPGTVPQPSGGFPPQTLPAPDRTNPATKGSQLFDPVQNPAAVSMRLLPTEPAELNHNSLETAQPVISPAAVEPAAVQSAAVQSAAPGPAFNAQRITSESTPAPRYQWPPANMLRPSAIKADFQTPVEPSEPKGSSAGRSAAWIEPLPPVDSSKPQTLVPSNWLRGALPATSPATPFKAAQNSRAFNQSDASVSLVILPQKPARAAVIPADDWSPNASAPVRFPVAVEPMNSPAALAASYKNPVTGERAVGYASTNSPGAIAPAANRQRSTMGAASEIRFSPLPDVPGTDRFSGDEPPATSMTAIDPLQIGRAMSDGQQPAMRTLPIQNALPTNRFDASDYVSQDRAAKPTAYASAQPPMSGGYSPETRRSDGAVQTVSFEQMAPSAGSNLGSINPLEVARSLGTTPAPVAPMQQPPSAGSAVNYYPPTYR